MSNPITVQQILDRIKTNGAGSTLHAGNGAAEATGVVVTYTPTLEVLRKAAAGGKNVIVCREGPYWSRNPEALSANPTFAYKRDMIEKNRLAVVQLRESDTGVGGDRYLRGLAEALDWDRYHRIERQAASEPYAPGNVYFRLPEMTLEALANSVCGSLKIRAARVIGEPGAKLRDVALTHGRMLVPELRKVLKEPAVDAVIIGEPVEWETSPYFQDLIASGQKKGLIAIGLEASEEPGGRLNAEWLKSLVPEVPIEWTPAGEPFTALR